MAALLKSSQSKDSLSAMLVNTRQAVNSRDLRTIPLPVLLASSAFIAFIFVLLLARRSNARAPAIALAAGGGSSTSKLPRGTKTVLLVGPLGAGKTALFSKLVYGSVPETFTSSTTNTALMTSNIVLEGGVPASLPLPKPLFVVDVPGHPRLRARELAQALPSADGVVFVLDATKAWTMRGSQEASEHMHVLLSLLFHLSQSSAARIPPVLVLLTKCDLLPLTLSPAAALERTRTALSRDLNSRRSGPGSAARQSSRLEALEAVAPTPASGGVLGGLLAIFGVGRRSRAVRVAGAGSSKVRLPEDEAEILPGEALDFEGEWEWEKAGCAGGIEWETGSIVDAPAGDKASEKVIGGIEAFRAWTSAL